MQVWPELRNFHHMRVSAARLISAVLPTIAGDLPPSSSVTLVKCLAAATITILPTVGDPVKKIWSNGRSSSICDVASPPSKSATSDAGKTSAMTLRIRDDTAGVISEGLMMTVLPAASAETSGPKHRLNG